MVVRGQEGYQVAVLVRRRGEAAEEKDGRRGWETSFAVEDRFACAEAEILLQGSEGAHLEGWLTVVIKRLDSLDLMLMLTTVLTSLSYIPDLFIHFEYSESWAHLVYSFRIALTIYFHSSFDQRLPTC